MLSVGKKAPKFTLESTQGEISLSDFEGKYLVVYFYPRDNTPGCTIEANEFQAAKRRFSARGCKIVGVSKDSMKSHTKFCDKQGLKFALASDPEGEMIERYGAWGQKQMGGRKYMGIIRSTVLIAPDGTVAHHWPKVRVKGHVADVLDKLIEIRDAASE